ncbi:MAG: hypothetical protein AMXMBFR59_38550 [Rhodanobacteraceae bacterium]
MQSWFLRVGATNIYDNLLDCPQLSVARGASLGMRFVVQELAAALRDRVEPISIGASEGLFAVRAGHSAEEVSREALAFLERDAHAHGDIATFVVDIHPGPEAADALPPDEALRALNRFRQMREPSVIWTQDRLQAAPDMTARPCEWSDRWVAQTDGPERDDHRPAVAGWVRQRYDRGRGAKQDDARSVRSFYQRELKGDGGAPDKAHADVAKRLADVGFAHDLGELARLPGKRNLSGKIAVFYADGNRFSAIKQQARTRKELNEFDTQLRSLRRGLLADLLRPFCDPLRTDLRGESPRDGASFLRLETLLWGGDEMILVVPAWHGLDLLSRFFAHTRDWKFRGNRLTHAAGLVFASAKTPIHQLTGLACGLADGIKARSGTSPENAWDYLVLESVDFIERDAESLRAQRYGALGTPSPLRAPPPSLSSTPLLDEEIRRSALRWVAAATRPSPAPARMAPAVAGQPAAAAREETEDQRRRRRFVSVLGTADAAKLDQTVAESFPPLFAETQPAGAAPPIWPWVHLCELWDYLPSHANAPAPAREQTA